MKTSAVFLQLFLSVFVPTLAEIQIKFTKSPESVTAALGDTVTFECEVNVPGDKIMWRRRAQNQSEDDWNLVTGSTEKNQVTSRLVFEVQHNEQSGLCQCVAFYGSSILTSVPARLSIARMDLSSSKLERREITTPPHNTVVLHCREPASEPPAVLTWFKETGMGTKTSLDTPNGVLVIHNATSNDSGVYGCTAANEYTNEEVLLPERTNLRVQRDNSDVVKFLETEDYVGMKDETGVLTIQLKADTPLRLWCGAVGTPPPRVTWTKDGENVPRRHEHMLTVSPFTSEDQGVYTCEAKNIRRSWKVMALQAPHWEGTVANVNVTEGGSAHVTCGRPLGQPPPKVHWLLNSQTVIHEKGITANGSELHIEHAEKRYAGIVQCFACNQLGCAYQAAFFTVVPTQIYDREYLLDTDKVMAATVSPKRHNRKNFRKNKGLMVPPSRPNVTRMSDTSVMVTWSNANHGIPIQFFKVQYKEAITNNTQWHTAKDDIPPYIHSREIDQLDTDKYYKFRIAAIYENQDNKLGPSSGKFHLHHGDMHQKPNAPKLTQAVATSPYTIVVNWTWSSTNGVPAEGFYVYWRTVSSAGAYQVAAAGGAARGAALRRLQPDTHYEVKACAYTAHAPSDFVSIPSTKTIRLANATETTTEGRLGDVRGEQAAPGALVTAGGVLGLAGVAAVLGVALLLLCRRASRPADDKEKVSVPETGSNNGCISAEVPITITANPMHAESGDSGVEMSFLHNNNTGNDDDDLPRAGKNAPNRQYV